MNRGSFGILAALLLLLPFSDVARAAGEGGSCEQLPLPELDSMIAWSETARSATVQAARECPEGASLNLPPKDYQLHEIEALQILRNVDRAFRSQAEIREWDLLTSGTFCGPTNRSAGVIMQNRQVIEMGDSKAWKRGGVAVLDDGRVVTCDLRRTNFIEKKRDLAAMIRMECSRGANRVVSFMGGASMLLAQGNKVPESDVTKVQKMAAFGWHEHRDSVHLLVGMRAGKAYLIRAYNDVRRIQRDLCKAGFDSLVKFDGGIGTRFLGRKEMGVWGLDTCTSMKLKVR